MEHLQIDLQRMHESFEKDVDQSSKGFPFWGGCFSPVLREMSLWAFERRQKLCHCLLELERELGERCVESEFEFFAKDGGNGKPMSNCQFSCQSGGNQRRGS